MSRRSEVWTMHRQLVPVPEPVPDFRSEACIRHDSRRHERLASLCIPVRNPSVLEVRAGIGDIETGASGLHRSPITYPELPTYRKNPSRQRRRY
jgi:hypothetical protein